jgi:hypothetical protein
MSNQGIFLTTLLSATIVLAPLGSLESVSAFEQISTPATAKPILIAGSPKPGKYLPRGLRGGTSIPASGTIRGRRGGIIRGHVHRK